MFDIIDVYISGEEGYHTYRIPSIIKTNDNTLLAFAEARKSRKDVSEQNIVVKRSDDNGNTWSSPILVAEDGRSSYANPCSVVIKDTGKILLFLQHYPYPCRERDVVPGIEGPKVCRNFVLFSEDDGKTWSNPRNITESTKRSTSVTSIASGPGIAIQKRRDPYKGRIIVPMNQGPWGKWKNYAVYSDNNGKTWKYGNTIPTRSKRRGGNEVQMVELKDGSVMANARNFGGWFLNKKKYRKVAISRDGAETWGNYRTDHTLIEPHCMASMFRFTDPIDGFKSRILFSNPASKYRRCNGKVRISYDEGNSWKYSKVLCPGRFTYSCLVSFQNYNIGCLFETGIHDNHEKIALARFDLDWLTDGQDS
ncbi:MAG: exo-alpha-sialidase [Candidatus Lokiarchaeota archaeon]|nr:exo-alpha-sialidase [Candidatus Lokiarchaeota archaeon]